MQPYVVEENRRTTNSMPELQAASVGCSSPKEESELKKRCSSCLQSKHVNQFGRHKHSKMERGWTYSSRCRECKKVGNAAVRYGLSRDQFDELFSRGRICHICKANQEYNQQIDIDHDHTSGLVRGLLCNRCNILVARMESATVSPEEFFQSLVAYLHGRNLQLKPVAIVHKRQHRCTCLRCNHSWLKRVQTKPLQCPNCGTRRWDVTGHLG